MASIKSNPQETHYRAKQTDRRGVIVLLPLFIATTFSFGYLTYQSLQTADKTSQPISATSKRADTSLAQPLDKAVSPPAPALAPIETPQSPNVQTPAQPVVPDGTIEDANKQTAASKVLQGTTDTRLQAPGNPSSLKEQLRSLLPR